MSLPLILQVRVSLCSDGSVMSCGALFGVRGGRAWWANGTSHAQGRALLQLLLMPCNVDSWNAWCIFNASDVVLPADNPHCWGDVMI